MPTQACVGASDEGDDLLGVGLGGLPFGDLPSPPEDEARVELERAGDRRRLALAAGKRAHRDIGIVDVGVEPVDQRTHAGAHRAAAENRYAEYPCGQLAAEEDVLVDRQILGQRKLL